MKLERRVEVFAELGAIIRMAVNRQSSHLTDNLIRLIDDHNKVNPWFTRENVEMALSSFGDELTEENLVTWVSGYPELKQTHASRNVAVIMAGNIPMVGFHDLLTVLISGNRIIAKTSSKDSLLIDELTAILINLEPSFKDQIQLTDGTITGFDTVIATGSDNTSRYFEYYFAKHPKLIRKNRTGVALLRGDETDKQLIGLGRDIFSYFGLGCRNVTKLYLPPVYNLSHFKELWSDHERLVSNQKYANNYDYNKAIAILNKDQFIDLGFVIMKEERSLFSQVGVVNYEHIENGSFEEVVMGHSDKIQVIVAGDCFTSFGQAQKPKLWDYSDGVDTLDFLLKIN
jgi:hypothetical protein